MRHLINLKRGIGSSQMHKVDMLIWEICIKNECITTYLKTEVERIHKTI